MEPGDVAAVELGDCEGITYVDTGMYDVASYGSVYVIDAPKPAVVDTGIGADYERVRGAIEAAGIGEDDLQAIAVTHVHLDHAGGAGRLARDYPNATVYVHEIGAPHLVDPEQLVEGTKRAVGDQWQYYAEPLAIREARIAELTDGDVIDLGDRELVAHHAPGHAPHQVVFHSPSDGAVFTADAAGIYVPERDSVEPTSPPPNFDPDQALEDVETIRDLEPSVLCYAHFGPARTGNRLEEYERVLSEWIDAVAAAREEFGGGGAGRARDDGVGGGRASTDGEDVAARDEAVIEHLLASVDTHEVWGREKAAAETAMNVRGVLHALDRS